MFLPNFYDQLFVRYTRLPRRFGQLLRFQILQKQNETEIFKVLYVNIHFTSEIPFNEINPLESVSIKTIPASRNDCNKNNFNFQLGVNWSLYPNIVINSRVIFWLRIFVNVEETRHFVEWLRDRKN